MINNFRTFFNSIWKAITAKDALEKKAKHWESMEAEEAEQKFYWWLAGATFLYLGAWSAGYSYAEILWMQREPSRLECRGESIVQETFKKYPLVSNPREFLIATGSEPAAERHLKEFYREMILNNFCVEKEEEGVPPKAAIGQYVELAVINLQ